MAQDNSIPLMGFQGESPVDNFLSNYSKSQQQAQGNELHQRKIGMLDQAEEERKRQLVADALIAVPDGDAAAFEQVKQGLVSQGVIDPQTASQYDVSRLGQLKLMSQKWREMKAFEMEQQQAAQRGRLTEAQIAAANRSNRGGAGGGSQVFNSAAQRAQLAQAYGIDPQSAAGQKFVLTGQLPASLSPTDKKAILEADQMVMASQQGLGMLNQAKTLNPKAAGGFGMGTLADIFAQIGDETALNTRDLENVLQSNVLPQLKVIFGGAPTEGERQILLDLQGSAKKTVEERRRIIDRSIAAANARIKFYQDQSNDLRGGTYYSPTRGQPQPPAAPAASTPAPKKTFTSGGYTFEEVD